MSNLGPHQASDRRRIPGAEGLSYGFEWVQVDGNDIFAVYFAVRDALAKAKSGNGPTFIECFTYRMSDHTTADDAGRYRSAEKVE